MSVSKEAIEAAWAAYQKFGWSTQEGMEKALEAALSVPAEAVVGEPENEAADTAGRKLSLWFFRDLSGEQRGKLFGLFGMNDAQKDTNHGYQAMALKQVLRALGGAK